MILTFISGLGFVDQAYGGDTTAKHPTSRALNSDRGREMDYVDIDLLVVFYTDYQSTTVSDHVSDTEIDMLKTEIEIARKYIWRVSNLNCNLPVTYYTCTRTLTPSMLGDYDSGALWLPGYSVDGSTSVNQDLTKPVSKGGPGFVDGQFSIVLVFYAFESGDGYTPAFRSATYPIEDKVVLDNAAYIAIPVCWDDYDEIIAHELTHAIDSIYHESGNPAGNDPKDPDDPVTDPFNMQDSGPHFQFLNMNTLEPGSWTQLGSDWATFRTLTDSDSDGIPDYSPDVPIDEASFGSSATQNDSDGDGLDDFGELLATYHGSSDPQVTDSDDDGVNDGSDTYPLYNFTANIYTKTVTLDGTINASEWIEVTNINRTSSEVNATFYAIWSGTDLYFAASVVDDMIETGYGLDFFIFNDNIQVRVDCQKDGFYLGDPNYRFVAIPKDSAGHAEMYRHNYYNKNWVDSPSSALVAEYTITSGGYDIEMKIPQSALGATVGAGQTIRVAFGVVDSDEYPYWSTYDVLTGGGFHRDARLHRDQPRA